MNLRISFRLRVALMAMLFSMLLIAAVTWLVQSQIQTIRQEQAIRSFCLEARLMAMLVRHNGPRDNVVAATVVKLKVPGEKNLLMHWVNSADDIVLQSQRWPADLNEASLDWQLVPVTTVDELQSTKGQVTSVACHAASFIILDPVRAGDWLAVRAKTSEGYAFLAMNAQSIVRATWESVSWPVLMLAIPVGLILALCSAWLLSLFVMRPVNRLSEAMASATPSFSLGPIPFKHESPEFERLITSYNDMLARLKTSFEQASRFSADAAHELKTPLTILRGQLEQALLDKSNNDSLLLSLQAQVSNLVSITRKLLLLSQADVGYLALDKTKIEWSLFVSSVIEDVLLIRQDLKLQADIEPNLSLIGDAVLLRQLCANLMLNALNYCRPTGGVRIVVRKVDDGVETVISNECDPISDEDRLHFFDRFYRRSVVRQQGLTGSGLGLSLAREVAKAHGGTLTLMPSAEDVVALRLWLPSRQV